VREANGELIAFFDSDDICVFDRIERQAALLRALPADYIGVYSTRLFYNDVEEATYSRMACHVRPFAHEAPLSGDIAKTTLRGNIINFPSLLVRKSALLAAGPSDELLRNNVDWDLCLRLTRQGKFGFDPEPLILTPTALKAEVAAQRISRSARYKAQSFVRVTGKLRRQGVPGPILAGHYLSAARYLIQQGRYGFARRFLRAALALKPVLPKAWAHYLLSYTPALHNKVKSLRKRKP
jgi:hypothetical protein